LFFQPRLFSNDEVIVSRHRFIMQSDQTKLLRSLAIARPEGASPIGQGSQGHSRNEHRRPASTWVASLGGGVILLGLFAYWYVERPALFGKSEVVSAESARPAAASGEVQAAPAPVRTAQNLIASGYIVARRKSVVGSEISGKISSILVEMGDSVTAGQPIARLDSTLAESDMALSRLRFIASEAAVEAIAADLADAERISDRTKTLSAKGFATVADQTKNETRVGVLRAQLNQARAQLNNAQRDTQRSAEMLDKYTIYSPFSGIVTERNAEVGEIIAPTGAGGTSSFTRTGICTIVNRDSIEAEVDVNEASIGRVQTGSKVTLSPDAYPDWAIPGTVLAIVPAASREKGTVKVRIAFDNKDQRFVADMGVKIVFLGQ